MYHKPEKESDVVLDSALSDVTLLSNPQELSKVLLANCSRQFWRAGEDKNQHARVREVFEHAVTVMKGVGGDPYFKLERFWIDLESRTLGDLDKARSLWKRLDNPRNVRKVFIRASNVALFMDWPERLFDAWLMFERECGDSSTYKDALARSREVMESVEAVRAQNVLQAEAAHTEVVAYESTHLTAEVDPTSEKPLAPETATPKEVSKKRKHDTQGHDHGSKIAKTDKGAKQTEEDGLVTPLNVSAGRHEDTCFVANFPPHMTEKRLKELFQE
ncbi:hypothetical protein BGZ65_005556, partial [Modicella reniformis]